MTTTTRTTRTKTNANAAQDPAALLLAALQASAKTNPGSARRTAQARAEELAQPLTDRDRAALEQMGWAGCRLSSPKASEPKPTAKVKSGPIVSPATFAELSPERQASAQFWAGLCSVLARSNGRVWLPEAAAVAAQLGVAITSPAQLAARLSALTGLPVSRPTTEAGWLVCEIAEPMAGAEIWAQLFNSHTAAYGAAVLNR